MCRFVAYLGKKNITLERIIVGPSHSLVKQSKKAIEGITALNADGFGIGWYEENIDNEPGLFKSIQPAWNDQNLKHIVNKIESTCFIGHVRASSIGHVNTLNCHPFSYKNILFAHNGTIEHFKAIRRTLLSEFSDNAFNAIQGQTDSEHLFTLFCDLLFKRKQETSLKNLADNMIAAIRTITQLQKKINVQAYASLNIVLTNGKQILVTRYTSHPDKVPNSLHYCIGDHVQKKIGSGLMHSIDTTHPTSILIASEPINEFTTQWQDVPPNSLLLCDENYTPQIIPINL